MAQKGGASKGVSTDAIIFWLQRNSAASQTGRYPRDAWHQFLVSQTTSDGTMADLEKRWLAQRIVALGGTVGNSGGWNDLWDKYLTLNPSMAGQTGDLDDKFAAWIDHGAI